MACKRKISVSFVCLFILIFSGCLPSEPATQTLNLTPAQISTETSTRPPTQEPTATSAHTPAATETKAPVLPPDGVLTQTQFEDLVIDEYLLAGPPDISTDMLAFGFAEGDKDEILIKTESYRDYQAQIMEYNNRVLEPFGYSQDRYNIYKSGEVVAHNIFWIQPVSVNASKTKFITEVELFDGTYVFNSGHIEKRAWPPDREVQRYVGDQILSLESISTAHQQGTFSVYLDDTLAYQTEIFPVSTYGTYDGPWSYGNHWALVLLDAEKDGTDNWKQVNRVILDGQDLNSAYGYEQSFQFAALSGHPFFFYQKGEKIGISFDGVEIGRDYDEIPHYRCCSSALLNPGSSMNMIWFFAKRDPNWYYVEAYVPLESDQ